MSRGQGGTGRGPADDGRDCSIVSSSQSPAFAGRPRGLVEKAVPGGARVLVLPTGAVPGGSDAKRAGVVALQLWVLSGTAAERAREHGCAHLLEHMLFKPMAITGAAPLDIATEIEGLGGDVNAFTSHDETVFHATVPAAATDAAIDALLPPLVSPEIDPAALAKETEVVVEEIRQYRDDPSSRLQQDVMSALFAEHAYGRPVLGTEQDVRGCSRARLLGFHRRAYAGQHVRLVVVGDVDPRRVIRRARKWLVRLPTTERSRLEPRPRPPGEAAVIVRRDDVLECHLELAWSVPALPEPEAVALEVASVVLGYGEAARLALGTRRRDQVVSDAHASFYGSRLGSTFLVTARMRAPQAGAAAAAVLEQVQRLRTTTLDAEELSRARAVLRSDLVYRRETTQGQAHALGYFMSLAGDLEADRRYYDVLSELSARDVADACAKWLRPDAAVLGIVVPEREVTAAQVASLRKSIASVVVQPDARRRGKRTSKRPTIKHKGGVSMVDLACGVRIRAVVDRRVPIVGGWLAWPGGLRLEDPRRAGASPVMAELLTRGCEAIDGDSLAREIDGMAAVLDGFSGRSSAGLHLECLSDNLPDVLRRALQCAAAPRFSADELEEERRVALADYEAEDDDLAKVAMRDVLSRVYVGHPFRLRRRGTPQSLGRLTADGLGRLWKRWYPLPRMVVGLAGDVDLEAVAEQVAAAMATAGVDAADVGTFPKWPGGGLRTEVRRPAGGEHRITRAKEQAHIALAYPGLPIGDQRGPALEVLMAVLGGQAGRLFLKLREDEGLVYHVSASTSEGIDAGDVVVYAATGQDKIARARAAIEAEIASLAAGELTEEELDRAKAWLCGQYDASLERRGRIASLVAFDEALGLPVGHCFGYRRRIERVEAKAIARAARDLLLPRFQIATIVSA